MEGQGEMHVLAHNLEDAMLELWNMRRITARQPGWNMSGKCDRKYLPLSDSFVHLVFFIKY